MKKYPIMLIDYKKYKILYAITVVFVVVLLIQACKYDVNVFFWLTFYLFVQCIFIVISLSADPQKIGCGKESLQLFVFGICTEKIDYSQMCLLTITNAVLGDIGSGGYGGIGVTPVGKRCIVSGKKKLFQMAALHIYRSFEVLANFEPSPRSYEAYYNYRLGLLYSSICWKNYLEDLLSHLPGIPVYVAEDVYERFKLDYDCIFSKAKNPIFIVTAPHTYRQFIPKK